MSRRQWAWLCVVLLAVTSLVLSLENDIEQPPSTAEPIVLGQTISRPNAPLAPTTGTLLGAGSRISSGFLAKDAATQQLTSVESVIGRKFDVSQHNYTWSSTFPTEREVADLQQGRIPLISWAGKNPRAIVKGSFDQMIRTRARAIAELGVPAFLSWGPKMNAHDGWLIGATASDQRQAARFIAAWHRIHDIFAEENATNAVWVWSPALRHSKTGRPAAWRNYYPGDDYVDWVGAVDDMSKTARRNWTFSSRLEPFYKRFSWRKPIMVETGQLPASWNESRWLSNARDVIKEDMPGVKAFVYSMAGGTDAEQQFSQFGPFAEDEHFNALFSPEAPNLPTPWVSVREFGADANGATDDTEAFRAALDTGRRIVYVPPGTYLLATQINVPSQTTIWLDEEATIQAADKDWEDTGMFGIGAVHHVTIRGGTLDGRKGENPSGRIFGIKISGSGNPSDVRILGISILKMPGMNETGQNGGDGIYMGSGEDILIDRVVLDRNVRQGISITGSVSNVRIRDSVFANTSGSRPGAGIDIEPNPGGKQLRDITISDSLFINNHRGVQLTLNEDAEGTLRDVVVSGNKIEQSRIEGMLIVGGPTVMSDLLIKDNKILRNAETGIEIGQAVEGRISRNRVQSNDGAGIQVVDDPAPLTIHDNELGGNAWGPVDIENSPRVELSSNKP